MMPYYRSKYLAEKAAWDYVAKLPEDQKFDLVAICPSLIMGPTKISKPFTSANFINLTMFKVLKKVPVYCLNLVDVREVAQAHIKSLTLERAKNQRFIIAANPIMYD